jgi:hypothetical protein
MVQPINTGFLTDTTASRFAGQQFSSGLGALGKGIATGMLRREEQDRLQKEAKAKADQRIKELEANQKFTLYRDYIKMPGANIKEVTKKMYPGFEGLFNYETINENKEDYNKALEEHQKLIDSNAPRKQLSNSLLDILRRFSGQPGLEEWVGVAKSSLPVTRQTPVSRNAAVESLKNDGNLNPSEQEIKDRKDRLAREKTDRLAEQEARIVEAKQRAVLAENVYDTTTGSPIVGKSKGDVIENENLVSLSKNDADQYRKIQGGMADKMLLVDVMRQGLTTKDGPQKFLNTMQNMFTNLGFLKQFKPPAQARMMDLIKGSLTTMMQEMGMGKVASDKDMDAVERKFVDIADSDAANEFKIAIFEHAIDNLGKNFLMSRSRKYSTEQLNNIFREQNKITLSVADLMTDNDNRKVIGGKPQTFSEFFKAARSGGLTGNPMKLKSILNAWNSPDGIEFTKGASQPTNQATGNLPPEVMPKPQNQNQQRLQSLRRLEELRRKQQGQ